MTRDTDLIRRGDAIKAVTDADRDCRGAHGARENIAALTTHTRYMPSSQEEDYDYGPPWWIAPAIAAGAAVFTLIVLWLAGVL